jgi:tetratricopeptide (TPR) repeat protein
MEHDLGVCACCGDPAGDRRFCESCRSRLDSLTDITAHAGACVRDLSSQGAQQTLSGAPHSESVPIIADATSPAYAGGDPRPVESSSADTGPRGPSLDKLSTSGDERLTGPAQEVARFEDLLTPAPTGVDSALAAYRQADADGDPRGSTNLGVLLEEQGDLDGALAAYRRADERGDVNGSFNLGCLLAESGDVSGAVAALRRADQRGDAAAASNLGVLLERRGDLDGALAAYRRADERGDASGAFNLGLLLAGRGDLAGAEAAYRRAIDGDDPEVQVRAQSALQELDACAEAARAAQAARTAQAAQAAQAAPQDPPTADAHTAASGRTSEDAPSEAPGCEQASALKSRPAGHGETGASEEPAAAVEPAGGRWMGEASRRQWVAVMCLVGVLGLIAVYAARRLR